MILKLSHTPHRMAARLRTSSGNIIDETAPRRILLNPRPYALALLCTTNFLFCFCFVNAGVP